MNDLAANLIAFVLLLGVTAYSVAGGVDYGAGIWDLLARGTDAPKEREAIAQAMAPVWEANNVWLVLSIVICWTGFPLLFESVFASLYPLFALALLGLILRGAFFAFRHVAHARPARRWAGIVFGAASVGTPFCFAACLGAIASGRVHVGGPVVPVWEVCVNPTSIAFGLVSVAATAFIGATFLVGDARRSHATDLVAYFRVRVIVATLALIVVGSAALVVMWFDARSLVTAMFTSIGVLFALATIVLTPAVGLLVWRRWYRGSRAGAVAAVGSLVFAWGFARSPWLLPGQLTIAQAAAPQPTEIVLAVVALVVVVVIVPSLVLLVYLDQRGALESLEG